MITPEEYNQFKAFTRQDGALTGVLMSVVFFVFIASFTRPALQLLYILGMISVPILIAMRVRNYRDKIVMARISKRRAFGYSLSCFMYGSLILALTVFAYFQFFDHGSFINTLQTYFAMPEMEQALKMYGMSPAVLKEELNAMQELRAIDVALSMITNTFTIGIFCSLIIALFSRREPRTNKNQNIK